MDLARSPKASAGQDGVLVVEDDAMSRQLLVRLLQMLGYQAQEAGDGAEALDLARSRRPRLVLMDLSMPGMDGLEAIRRFHDDPLLQGVPIIALTGHVGSATRDAVCRHGAAGMLEKPIDLPALERFLDTYLPKP
jgi:CheY-like chemotaxis protein